MLGLKRVSAVLAAAVGVGLLAALPADAGAAPATNGSSMTVIMENGIFLSLDPSNNQFVSVGQLFFNAIFDNLFFETANGGVGEGLVTSYKFANDSRTFTFAVRHGLRFTDGTPFDAQAVVFNIKRDLQAGCLTYGTCDAIMKNITSVSAPSEYTVTMKMSAPSPTMAAAFVNNAPDWIGSPTAIKKEGKAFSEHPVGLGAYEVQSFASNAKVALTKNPHYYLKGEPVLDKLTFLNGSVDQSSFAALQSGSAQMVVGITTPSIVKEAESSGFNVRLVKSPVANFLSLNTFEPPFNNIDAREAVADAVNQQRMVELNSSGLGATVEDVMGPAGYGYEKTVPGYRGLNLTKAKQLVAKIGGLSFTILGGSSPANQLELTSLQGNLAQAGIKVKLVQASIAQTKTALGSGKWTAELGSVGGVDPVIGPFSFLEYLKSTGVYACCKDKTLDGMIDRLITTPDSTRRVKMIQAINHYVVVQKQYVVPLYSAPATIIASKSVVGISGAPAVLPVQVPIPLNRVSLK